MCSKSERRCVCFDCATLGPVPLSIPTLILIEEQTTDSINWNPRGFMFGVLVVLAASLPQARTVFMPGARPVLGANKSWIKTR